ncbi:MAG: sigma-54-dependent Fis family transcriptional regulator [Myxococcales bacterium]|nr:sigma-54-dependent Fis family transcriptional regulator [Myxococcales bacterium]
MQTTSATSGNQGERAAGRATANARVLVLSDDSGRARRQVEALEGGGYAVALARSTAVLDATDAEVVLCGAGGPRALAFCRRAAQARPDVPVIVLDERSPVEFALEAMRAGAYDFLTSPLDDRVLLFAVAGAVDYRRASHDRNRPPVEPGADEGPGVGLLGESPAMRALRRSVERVSPTNATVLLLGESGTGKEVVASALHRGSLRASGPFVPINCAALPAALLESELFGHAKGAFTGATSAKQGLFVEASGGTLFLDEIGDLPLALQPKLLRALQERCVRPVGGGREIPVDVRLVAATNRDLRRLVDEQRFREDLFYRLSVVEIDLPPLRRRGQDVLLFANHCLERLAGRMKREPLRLAPAVAQAMLTHDWPGNVRELENCVERAVALAQGSLIELEDLPESVRRAPPTRDPDVAGGDRGLISLEETERRHVLHVLEAVGGNKSLAAQVLGVDRKTLYRKLALYGAGSAGR